MQYDPLLAPGPTGWLATHEGERIELVMVYHRWARVKLPNQRLHAAIHVVIENQGAMGDELPVRRVLDRRQAEGLDRHAIGSVVAGHMVDLLKDPCARADPNAAYWAELESLTAEMRRSLGS